MFLNQDDPKIDIRADAALIPTVMRAIAGKTVRDAEVDAQPLPSSPFWLYLCVRLLRLDRRLRPRSIGQRCVCDPSCSRYAELAFRNLGLAAGFTTTLKRLHRCKPKRGGVDLPNWGQPWNT